MVGKIVLALSPDKEGLSCPPRKRFNSLLLRKLGVGHPNCGGTDWTPLGTSFSDKAVMSSCNLFSSASCLLFVTS